jgi:hypothetical protein
LESIDTSREHLKLPQLPNRRIVTACHFQDNKPKQPDHRDSTPSL